MTFVDEDLRTVAKERVHKRRDLGTHFVAYVVVNAMFVAMWAVTGGGYFWPAWVIFLWGIGLVLNVWDVYFRRSVTEQDIEREMEKLQR